MGLIRGDTKLVRSFRGALFTVVGVLVSAWVGDGNATITGLWDTVRVNWDSAGGAGIAVLLGAYGFFSFKATPTGNENGGG